MPNPGEKTKKKKFRKTTSGKVVVDFTREKTGKHHCGVCGKILHGVPHGKTTAEVKKLSKSKRRPSAPFAGVLCNQCRALAAAEAAKILSGAKKLEETDLRLKNFVNQFLLRLKESEPSGSDTSLNRGKKSEPKVPISPKKQGS